MKKATLANYARQQMKAHGVTDWKFRYSETLPKNTMGIANWWFNTILFNPKYLEVIEDNEILRQVVLHEIAHVLTVKDGHNREFRATCKRIGCRISGTHLSDTYPEVAKTIKK